MADDLGKQIGAVIGGLFVIGFTKKILYDDLINNKKLKKFFGR